MTTTAQNERSGWLVVAGLVLVMAVSHGITTAALPTFDNVLLSELGIARAELKLRESIFLLASGAAGLGIGYLTHILRPRTIVMMGLAILAATLAAYSQATSIGQIYWLYAILGMCYATSHVVIVVLMISQSLDTRQALAISVALSGTSLGSAIFPNLSVAALDAYNWRDVLMMLAILPLIIIPITAFLLPSAPTTNTQSETETTGQNTATKPPAQAVFFLLVINFGIFFAATAIMMNLFLHLQDIGLTPANAAAGLSAVFFVGLVGKVLVGAAAERWGVHRVWLSEQVILLAGALLIALGKPDLALAGLLLLGLGWAGCYVLTQVVISEVFAGPNLGKVVGGFILVAAIASSIGVWSVAALFDVYGSYSVAFQMCCGLIAMTIVASLLFARSLKSHNSQSAQLLENQA